MKTDFNRIFIKKFLLVTVFIYLDKSNAIYRTFYIIKNTEIFCRSIIGVSENTRKLRIQLMPYLMIFCVCIFPLYHFFSFVFLKIISSQRMTTFCYQETQYIKIKNSIKGTSRILEFYRNSQWNHQLFEYDPFASKVTCHF